MEKRDGKTLTSITLKDGDEPIEIDYGGTYANSTYYGAFYASRSVLNSLYVGRNVTFPTGQGYYSPFYYNSVLTSLTIGPKVTEIPDYLFYGNTGAITTVTIPANVEKIGYFAFSS